MVVPPTLTHGSRTAELGQRKTEPSQALLLFSFVAGAGIATALAAVTGSGRSFERRPNPPRPVGRPIQGDRRQRPLPGAGAAGHRPEGGPRLRHAGRRAHHEGEGEGQGEERA
jgi:hypothetical protein